MKTIIRSEKTIIRSEISCDKKGLPIYHEECIDCIDIWPSDMTIIRIYIIDKTLHIDLKENFKTECIELDTGKMCSIKKSDHIPSKRVGKNALYRCFNCKEADECEHLTRESTSIQHAITGVL